jgi:hypothetical protein
LIFAKLYTVPWVSSLPPTTMSAPSGVTSTPCGLFGSGTKASRFSRSRSRAQHAHAGDRLGLAGLDELLGLPPVDDVQVVHVVLRGADSSDGWPSRLPP